MYSIKTTLPTSESHFCLNSSAVMASWNSLVNLHQHIPLYVARYFLSCEDAPRVRPSRETRLARVRGLAKIAELYCRCYKKQYHIDENGQKWLREVYLKYDVKKKFDGSQPRNGKDQYNFPAWVEKDIELWLTRQEIHDDVSQSTKVDNFRRYVIHLCNKMQRRLNHFPFSERAVQAFDNQLMRPTNHFDCPDECCVCPRSYKKIRFQRR